MSIYIENIKVKSYRSKTAGASQTKRKENTVLQKRNEE